MNPSSIILYSFLALAWFGSTLSTPTETTNRGVESHGGHGHHDDPVILTSKSCKILGPGSLLIGNILTTVKADYPSHCCLECEKFVQCVGWLWSAADKECELKYGEYMVSETPSPVPEDVSGIMGDARTCTFHNGKDISNGVDLVSFPAYSPANCCGICAGTTNCQAFTHNTGFPGLVPASCYLKTGTGLSGAMDATTSAGILIAA